MGTAMYTGVTGLRVHQEALNVIANNIANVNTTGYRSSRMLFQDLFSQTLEGATGSTETYGGSNPKQVGLGVQIASIDTDFTQGALTSTGINTDLAIEGTGFFVLTDGATMYYTRDGAFNINTNGEIVDEGTGLVLQGYLADSDGNIDTATGLADIRIPLGAESIVRETTSATLAGNLTSDAAEGTTVERTITVYDSLGTARAIDITFTKTANTNEWDWSASSTDTDISAVTGSGTITFTSDGEFSSVTSSQISVDFDDTAPSVPTDPLEFNVGFSDITMLSQATDVFLYNQDGRSAGVLDSFSIGANGLITGVYTNGEQEVIGQIALASFTNEGGLMRSGDNLFMESPNSGIAQVGLADTGSRGSIAAGTLESSNVDLAQELSNLILTQRGYQANARTITAADTLLQEAVNLVR